MTNPMTPTEQDKELQEQVEGIFKNPHCESCHEDWDYDSSYRTDSCCTRFMSDSISKVMQLITADRKRVAMEARIDFANDMLKMNKWNEKARTDELYKIIRTSKAQQEEV